ncbi:YheC/YheD family protein [Clostridium sp. 19966]|uniref:YheC/YheD family endospore coat-associated protein n=1 Tax=Clostridium sp. 19966 TaxID=2768166 RepID=UPI0028DEF2F3|nr:YheC/YheD family protein [Clostridium sp. 19966]MDT8718050.1 YheC/YheD family protein [Clostridium sp. 19966]
MFVISTEPIIGVFTNALSISKANHQRPTIKMQYLFSANKNLNMILYFFSSDNFLQDKQKINGTYYNYKTEIWEKRLFPFPDVLYDRGGDIEKCYENKTNFVRSVLYKDANIKKLNPAYIFDKWVLHEYFMKYGDMALYLPYTVRFASTKDLLDILNKSNTIYIKDRTGNRGLGVVRVIKLPSGIYEFDYCVKNQRTDYFYSFRTLVNKLNNFYKDKEPIIQIAIDTLKINDRNIDMRATVQRNAEGQLEIIAFPVRVAIEGSHITSTRTGSEVYDFKEFFRLNFNFSEKQLQSLTAKIKKFLLITYNRVEEKFGRFGEMGIDFALDKDFNIWLIECNAKPGKDTIYLCYGNDVVSRAFSNPLQYSKFLCSFDKSNKS